MESRTADRNVSIFGRNTLVYGLGNILSRVGAFLLIPLYTHSLSLSDYGLLSTLFITVQVMSFVMGMGTYKGVMRFAGDCLKRNRMKDLIGSTVVTTVASSAAVTGSCLFILPPFFRRLLHTPDVEAYILLICFVSLFQSLYLHLTSYYRIRNQGFKFVVANLAVLAFLVLTNVIFLRVFAWGAKGAMAAQVVTYGALWLVLFSGLIKGEGLGISLNLTKKLLKFSLPLLVTMLWSLVIESSAVYFLGYFAGLEEVAVYSLGCRIAQIAAMVLILPFQLAYEPFVYSHAEHPWIKTAISKILTYLMLALAFMAFGIVFASRPLLSVIAPSDYFAATHVVFMMMPGIAFTGVYYVAESLLGIVNKTSLIGGLLGLFTGVSVILNYLLIQVWGMYGAILVFNLTTASTALILMSAGIKAFPIPLEGIRLSVAGILMLLLLGFVFLFRGSRDAVYYTFVPAIGILALFFIYLGNFFDDREKRYVRKLFRVRSVGSAQEVAQEISRNIAQNIDRRGNHCEERPC